MDYLKIIETANRCEIKKLQIFEYYRLIGANNQFDVKTLDCLYKVIEDIKSDLQKFESKLKKLIT